MCPEYTTGLGCILRTVHTGGGKLVVHAFCYMANRRTYPKRTLNHRDVPDIHFTKVPSTLINNVGVWSEVTQGQKVAWIQLRSLDPRRQWSTNAICNVLNIDRRNFVKMLPLMEEAGIVQTDGINIATIDPEANSKPQAKTEEEKKDKEEEQTKQREKRTNGQNGQMFGPVLQVLRQQVKSATKVIPSEVVTPSAPRKIAPIVRHAQGGSAAPDIIDELVQTWNEYNAAKCDGFYYKNVNRKGFSEEAIETVQKYAFKYCMTPAAVLKRIMWSGVMTDHYASITQAHVKQPGSTPNWLLGQSNYEFIAASFSEERRELEKRDRATEYQIFKSFDEDCTDPQLREVIGLGYGEVHSDLSANRLETMSLMKGSIGAMSQAEIPLRLKELNEKLVARILNSPEYKALKANPTKTITSQEMRKDEDGRLIIEKRANAHGEMRSHAVMFPVEKEVSTASDHFPIFYDKSKSFFARYLEQCDHYNLLQTKVQTASEV